MSEQLDSRLALLTVVLKQAGRNEEVGLLAAIALMDSPRPDYAGVLALLEQLYPDPLEVG